VLTATFAKAFVDVYHFMVIFSLVFVIWMVGGMVLFGGSVKDFADIEKAGTTCFRVVLGDLVWDDVREQGGPLAATMWLWSFTFLCRLVMLNILLAVITDCYTEIKGSVGASAETLPGQALESFKRWRARVNGQRLSLKHISSAFHKHGFEDDKLQTVDTFCEAVPGMREAQAERLLAGALRDEDDEARQGVSIASTAMLIGKVHDRVKAIHRSITTLMNAKGFSLTSAHIPPKAKLQNAAPEAAVGPGLLLPDLAEQIKEELDRWRIRRQAFVVEVESRLRVVEQASAGSPPTRAESGFWTDAGFKRQVAETQP